MADDAHGMVADTATLTPFKRPDQGDTGLFLWRVIAWAPSGGWMDVGGGLERTSRQALTALVDRLRTAPDTAVGTVMSVPVNYPVSFDDPVPLLYLATVDSETGAVTFHDTAEDDGSDGGVA